MARLSREASKYPLLPLVFGQDALAASQTDVQLPPVAGEASQANDGYTMPFAGEIVAVSGRLSAAGSAGTLTIGANINGTEVAASTVTVTTSQVPTKTVPRGTRAGRFAAGAVIGCEITTDASWNGTTADLVAMVLVQLTLDGI
jgi:hypothetical protein